MKPLSGLRFLACTVDSPESTLVESVGQLLLSRGGKCRKGRSLVFLGGMGGPGRTRKRGAGTLFTIGFTGGRRVSVRS